MNQISQSLARPARTAVQMVPSAVITEFIDAFIYNMNEKQYAALAAILLLAFGYGQVLLESKVGKALFRNVNVEEAPVVSSQAPDVPVAYDAGTVATIDTTVVTADKIKANQINASDIKVGTVPADTIEESTVTSSSNEVPEVTDAVMGSDTSLDPRSVIDFHVGAEPDDSSEDDAK